MKCFLANPFVKKNGGKQLERTIANREVSDVLDPTVQICTGHKKPRSPDQGKRKMGAAGLEPAGLTDVNPKVTSHARDAILLVVESFNN
jgi:hypothetical protein